MKIKIIIGMLCSSFLLMLSTNVFSQGGEVIKIGISVWTGYPASVQGFKEAMKEGGFIEGKNVEYLFKKTGADKEKVRKVAQGFKEAKVDLVYTLTTPGTVVMKEVMPKDTPIVFSVVTYPADSGLIESFEYSGNNLVGTSNYVELINYVKLLKKILPETKTLAIFHRKGEPNSKIQAANIIRLLKKEGIEIIDLEPANVDEMRQMALDVSDKVDIYMTTTDTLCQGGGESALIEVSREKKIPILSSNKAGIEAGSTFGPVADFYTLGHTSGDMAVKILKENVHPSLLESKLQDPPLILVNRKSIEMLSIQIPEEKLENLQYVEEKKLEP